MDSKQIFKKVDSLRERTLISIGTLACRFGNDAGKGSQPIDSIDKNNIPAQFGTLGDDLKKGIESLARIGKNLRELEQIAAEEKHWEIKKLELLTEIYEISEKVGADAHKVLNDTFKQYEEKLREDDVPVINKDGSFSNIIEHVIGVLEKELGVLNRAFTERLEDKRKTG